MPPKPAHLAPATIERVSDGDTVVAGDLLAGRPDDALADGGGGVGGRAGAVGGGAAGGVGGAEEAGGSVIATSGSAGSRWRQRSQFPAPDASAG
jgi:hypothetical protein